MEEYKEYGIEEILNSKIIRHAYQYWGGILSEANERSEQNVGGKELLAEKSTRERYETRQKSFIHS